MKRQILGAGITLFFLLSPMAAQPCLSAQITEEKIETVEFRDIEAVLLSLSSAEKAQQRLTTISYHPTHIQLAVNDLLKATDPLPVTDPLLKNQLESMEKNMDGLRTIYKKLIEDYLDLILGYYRQFPISKRMSGAPTEKSSPRQSKHAGVLETRKTLPQFQMEIEKEWNSIPSLCVGIAYALVAHTPDGKNSKLMITEGERVRLLSKIDHLFPELDQRRKTSRSNILNGAAAIRNVLQEIPVKRKHPPRLSRLRNKGKILNHTPPPPYNR